MNSVGRIRFLNDSRKNWLMLRDFYFCCSFSVTFILVLSPAFLNVSLGPPIVNGRLNIKHSDTNIFLHFVSRDTRLRALIEVQ